MASELEKLLISLDADTRKLRIALAQSEKGVQGFEKAADSALGKTERRFERMGGSIGASLGQLGAAMAGFFAMSKIRQDLIDVTALERSAARVGMTTDQLQKMGAVASTSGVSMDQLVDALKDLNMKMGEFHAGSGGFYDYMKRHLPTVHAQLAATKSTAEALDVVADASARFASSHERAAFLSQALGETGTLLTNQLVKGSAALREAGKEAEKYGQILSADAIKNTSELNAELTNLTATASTKFKEALGTVAPYITGFIRAMRDPTNTAFNLSGLVMSIAAGEPIIQKKGEVAGVKWSEGFAASAKKMLDSGAVIKPLKLQVHIPDFSTEISYAGADALAEMRIKTLQSTGDAFEAISAEYDRDLERFRRLLSEKQIDEADFQKAREHLSIQAGDKIKKAYDEERAAVKALGEEFSGAMENAFGDAFSELLENGKVNFKQFAASIMADIAKVYVQSQLIKPLVGAIGGAITGGLGGVGGIGALQTAISTFGGFRAAGGPVSSGKSYIVGERGPELFTPGASGGNITPNKSTGGNVYNIDARNADIGVEERIRAMMMRVERERQSPVAAVSQYQRRFPTRKAA